MVENDPPTAVAGADQSIRAGTNGNSHRDEIRTVEHICAIAGAEIDANKRALYHNTDETMRRCARAALDHVSTLPHADFAIPEKTPDETAYGKGRTLEQNHIRQFGAGSMFGENARS